IFLTKCKYQRYEIWTFIHHLFYQHTLTRPLSSWVLPMTHAQCQGHIVATFMPNSKSNFNANITITETHSTLKVKPSSCIFISLMNSYRTHIINQKLFSYNQGKC
ncbi:unnamed protein product, partial [Meganyctiphanes norvegica]